MASVANAVWLSCLKESKQKLAHFELQPSSLETDIASGLALHQQLCTYSGALKNCFFLSLSLSLSAVPLKICHTILVDAGQLSGFEHVFFCNNYVPSSLCCGFHSFRKRLESDPSLPAVFACAAPYVPPAAVAGNAQNLHDPVVDSSSAFRV